MRKKSCFILLMLFLAECMFAQITGKVENEYGALSGAMVSVNGTKNITETDSNGAFSIEGSVGDVIKVINPVTLNEKTFQVKKLNMGVLKMSEKEVNLDVVVAFGKQKKSNLTGAISVVDSKALEGRPVSNAVEALQGQVAGMNFSIGKQGGELGSSPSFNIRGVGTIGEGSKASPLVLIDGTEGDLSSINPQDIESISVLKDAASSSIYGSRAAFGVILVTTKSGKSGRVMVNYNNNFRWATPLLVPKMIDSEKFAYYWNDARKNGGMAAIFSDETIEKIKAYKNGELEYATEWAKWNNWKKNAASWDNVDWYKEYYRSWSPSQEHNLSLNGGTEKVSYYLSANYLKREGLMRYNTDTYDRFSLNGKFSVQVNRWLKVDYNSRFTKEEKGGTSYPTNGFYYEVIRKWPTFPRRDTNGNPVLGSMINEINTGRKTTTTNTLLQQINVTLSPVNNWNTYFKLSYRNGFTPISSYKTPRYEYDKVGNAIPLQSGKTDGSNVEEWSNSFDFISPNIYSEYSKEFGANYFKLMAGFQSEYRKNRNVYASRDVLIDFNTISINTTQGENTIVKGGYGEWSTTGFFGRLNYNYDEKYLLEFNLRYDGTSRFLEDKRWNWFPSASLGWNVARENFWQSLGGFFNKFNVFKFRASYGQLGNQNTNSLYPFYLNMPTGVNDGLWLIDGNRTNTAKTPGMVSSLLTWERVATKNLGLDIVAFKNRFDLTLDFFERKTTGMVGPAPELPETLGTNPPKVNNADLQSRGVELVIGWRDNIGKDFSYSIRANMTDSKQKILYYAGNSINNIYGFYDGKVLGEIWGFETHGIAKTNQEMIEWLKKHRPNFGVDWTIGDIMFEDLNGDGEITKGNQTLDNHGDLKVIGNSTPRYNFGLDLSFRYKDFDFRAFFQGTGKRDMSFEQSALFRGANGNIWQASAFVEHLDYFRPADTNSPLGPNVNAYYPKAAFGPKGQKNYEVQTGFLQNAAYVRLKNIQFGYTLSKNLMKKLGIDRLRIYVSAENVFTLTKMTKLFDPETPEEASGWWKNDRGRIYPLSRVISTGLSLTF